MKKFKQQAYYIKGEKITKLLFIDRSNYFTDKESAYNDIERFASKTKNRIPNLQYYLVITEEEVKHKDKTNLDQLLKKF